MICLQNIVWPEETLVSPTTLYFRTTDRRPVVREGAETCLPAGQKLSFDTYFNAFNFQKWHRLCGLDRVLLDVELLGEVHVRLIYASSGGARTCVDDITLEHRQPATLERMVTLADVPDEQGLLYLEIEALSDAVIGHARFKCDLKPLNAPKLAICITTFQREAQVEETCKRLEGLLQQTGDALSAHVFVVDNGRSAKVQSSSHLTYLENKNLGGAGGFARGLIEAEDAGFSHCLFMDDDASFHMENIVRAYAFLAFAKGGRAALAGAMISNRRRWRLWENGATFNLWPRRQFRGTDLRSMPQILDMEADREAEEAPTRYGAWWFFAFPISAVRHHPYPFFVRGDDVNFGLLNQFEVATLNGVVSFQDDFQEKTTPQNIYLDVRHGMVQHLTCKQLKNNPFIVWYIAAQTITDCLLRMHYDSARAVLLAWHDVLNGPESFLDNLDMKRRRADIAGLYSMELLSSNQRPHDVLLQQQRSNWLQIGLAVLSFNGHLMPFYRAISVSSAIPFAHRFKTERYLGVGEMEVVGAESSYVVRHCKRSFVSILWQSTRLAVRLLFSHRRLTSRYRARLDEMTSKDSWRRWLELD